MATNVSFTAALGIEHYIVPMRMKEITLEDALTAKAGGTSLTAWLDKADAISGPLDVSYTGEGSSFVLTIDGDSYPLDGTGVPIRLNNVTSSPVGTSTSDESVITHDQVTRGAAIKVGLSSDSTISFKGMTVHRSVDHKIMQVFREVGVTEQLAVKYLRVGPGGTIESKLGYGQFVSVTEEGDAGQLVKYSANFNVLGLLYTIFDND